jgi:hypothetical protein
LRVAQGVSQPQQAELPFTEADRRRALEEIRQDLQRLRARLSSEP